MVNKIINNLQNKIWVLEAVGSTSDELKFYKEIFSCINNLQKENERLKENSIHNDKVVDKAKWNEMIYKSRNEKAVDGIQQLIDDINNKTIISFKNFIPKLEEIQDKLAGGDE